MQIHHTLLFLLGLVTFAHTLALPASLESWTESTRDLFKRKGGGGGGGRGGGGSSGGSRGSGASSGNSGGGRAVSSGPARSYGTGGGYYGGGASAPYIAGSSRGVAPYLLGGAALGFFPGLWLYSVYAYSWPGNYHWRNTTTNQNETGPVSCLCQQYSQCGCEANNNTDYLDSVANDKNVSYRAANGTLYVNGTLPNDTSSPGMEGAARSLRQSLVENSGYWVVVAGVTYAVSIM